MDKKNIYMLSPLLRLSFLARIILECVRTGNAILSIRYKQARAAPGLVLFSLYIYISRLVERPTTGKDAREA